MKGLFLAHQSTTIHNILPIIKSLEELQGFDYKFLDISNLYKNDLNIRNHLQEENIIKFSFPSFINIKNKMYSPSLILKALLFLIINSRYKKLIAGCDFVCFSPGGAIEGEIARIASSFNILTVQIEGGIPMGQLRNLSSKDSIQKKLWYHYLPFTRFKKNVRRNPLLYIDYFVASGKLTQSLFMLLGYQPSKVLNLGVPRYENNNVIDTTKVNSLKKLVYICGAFDFHNDHKNSEEMIGDITNLNKFCKENNILLSLKLHPRQTDEEIKDIKNLDIDILDVKSINNLEINSNTIFLTKMSESLYEILQIGGLCFYYNFPEDFKDKTSLWPEEGLIINKNELSDLFKRATEIDDAAIKKYINFAISKSRNSSLKISNLIINSIKDNSNN